VVPEAIADETRRHGDEAVRRIREESRRRIAQRGRGAGPSRCMVGVMLAMLLFLALESRRAYWAHAASIAAQAARSTTPPAPAAAVTGPVDKGHSRPNCMGIHRRHAPAQERRTGLDE
jgi:hypothetical protein